MTQSPESDQSETLNSEKMEAVEQTEQTERQPKEITLTDIELEKLQKELADYKNKYFLLFDQKQVLFRDLVYF